jgi:alpha-L-fucosidase 2
LPAAWKDGHVRGLVARGNFAIEMWWKNGKLSKVILLSKNGGPCNLRTNIPVNVKGVVAKATVVKDISQQHYLYSFPTVAGKSYEMLSK